MKRKTAKVIVPFTPNNTNINWGKVSSYIRNEMRHKFRNYGTQTSTQPERKGGNSFSYNTVQHDVQRQYRRRRMPYYKRKVWRKFVKRVHAVANIDVGLRTVVFNDVLDNHSPTINTQQFKTISLYGKGGSESDRFCGNKDLFEINANDVDILPTSKVQFRSAVCDITMNNVLFEDPEVPGGASPYINYTLEVDVYMIRFPRDHEDVYANIAELYNIAYSETEKINAGGTQLLLSQRGVTPFDLGRASALGGMQVYEKRRYLISLGQSVTFQVRDPRNHWINGKDMTMEDQDWAKQYLTTTYLIIYRPTDRSNNGSSGQLTSGLTVNCSRHYTYKVESPNINVLKNNFL